MVFGWQGIFAEKRYPGILSIWGFHLIMLVQAVYDQGAAPKRVM
jgi:hypothetical protein